MSGYWVCSRGHETPPEEVEWFDRKCKAPVVIRSGHPVERECLECGKRNPSIKKEGQHLIHLGPRLWQHEGVCGGLVITKGEPSVHVACGETLVWVKEPMHKDIAEICF